MADMLDSVADRFREEVRLRALARAKLPGPRAPRALRIGAILVAVALHLGAAIFLYFLMQQHPAADRDRIEVRLLYGPPPEPALPEPPPPPAKAAPPIKPSTVPVRQSSQAVPAPASVSAAPNKEALPDTVTLFRADGMLRLPEPLPPKLAPHEERIRRGREVMARGLDCATQGPDDLSHRESVGEEVTRKYLSWIGLYNAAAAERRAEEEEHRQTRCRMWQGAGP
jgi:hypothetical protein